MNKRNNKLSRAVIRVLVVLLIVGALMLIINDRDLYEYQKEEAQRLEQLEDMQ